MKSKILFLAGILISVLSAGCSNLITEEYVLKNQKLKKVVLEMRKERAVEVVRRAYNANRRNNNELTFFNESGFGYDYPWSVATGPGTTYTEFDRTVVRYPAIRGTGHRDIIFSDVDGIVFRDDIGDFEVWLIRFNNSGVGSRIYTFDLGGPMECPPPDVEVYSYSKDEINELIASLLVLCSNAHRDWTRFTSNLSNELTPPVEKQPSSIDNLFTDLKKTLKLK